MLEIILEWDKAVFFAVNHGLHYSWLDPVMWFMTSLGLGQVQAGILLGWALLRKVTTQSLNPQALPPSKLFLSGAAALAFSGLLAQLVKHLTNRPRPSHLPEAIVAPDERIFMNSFPSGHTATAFAFACFVWMQVRGTRSAWIGWLAWGLAVLIGISRIYRGVHYPSDVLAGAVIGVLCCLSLWRLLRLP